MDLYEFIDAVGNAAVKYYPKYKILPSLCIAQALQESNKADYKKGQLKLSGLATECHNYFGMKYADGCGTDKKAYISPEWNAKKQCYENHLSEFRKYPSMESGIAGYFDFLTYKRYKNLQGVTDYVKACELISADGWATSPTYTQNLIKKINDLQLYKYDEVALGHSVKTQAQKLPTPTLKKGMNDRTLGANYIKSWERYLSLLGLYNGAIDGIFGPKMEQAVKEYQSSKKLRSDGIIGALTWGTLNLN